MSCMVGERMLFEGFDLTLKPGDIVTIAGDNGSGKSTLLRCLAGLLPLASGTVSRTDKLHFLGHKPGVVGVLSPLANLRWCAASEGRPFDELRAGEALRRTALWRVRHKPCQTLSAGQQRRVALARLLAFEAELWLLDEPTTSLDAEGGELLRTIMREHVAAGGGVVCASHDDLAIDGAHRIDLCSTLEPVADPCQGQAT